MVNLISCTYTPKELFRTPGKYCSVPSGFSSLDQVIEKIVKKLPTQYSQGFSAGKYFTDGKNLAAIYCNFTDNGLSAPGHLAIDSFVLPRAYSRDTGLIICLPQLRAHFVYEGKPYPILDAFEEHCAYACDELTYEPLIKYLLGTTLIASGNHFLRTLGKEHCSRTICEGGVIFLHEPAQDAKRVQNVRS